jgi:DNA-binding HxlR family transcriptional regulator
MSVRAENSAVVSGSCLTRQTVGRSSPEACPTRQVLDLIADKWSTLIVGVLATGALRFGQVAQRIPGLDRRVLSRALRTLERDGIIARHVLSADPPAVEYSLTGVGDELHTLVEWLSSWARYRVEAIRAARREFDGYGSTRDRTPWQTAKKPPSAP